MNAIAFDIDGIKYLPVKTKIINNIKYYLLVNIDDKNDICIRKEIKENNEVLLSQLEEEEFDKVINELEM